MNACKGCQHLEHVGGRIVSARCLATGITFPAKGVSCTDMGHRGSDRVEISPGSFDCPFFAPIVMLPRSDGPIYVVNGEVV